jgi:hypothetical protein
MKNSLKTLILATVATASSAFAATTTDTFTNGDIMLGFFASSGTGAGQNLMVNLGSFTEFDNYDSATTNFSSGIVADLSATYGADWNTLGLVKWSLIGTTGSTAAINGVNRKTIFTTIATGSAPIAAGSDSIQGGNVTNITSIATGYNLATTTANSTVSVVMAASNANSMQARLTTANSVRFGPTNQILATGTSVLDFYAVIPTGVTPSGLAVDSSEFLYASGPNLLGSFTLDASGLSFTAQPVPEPSTYAALAGAAVLGLAAYRRRPAARV